jgi:hypothetical protein
LLLLLTHVLHVEAYGLLHELSASVFFSASKNLGSVAMACRPVQCLMAVAALLLLPPGMGGL